MSTPRANRFLSPELLAVLIAVLASAAVTLLASGRDWQSIVIARPRPLADDLFDASGRTLYPVLPALAVVALAAVVAIVASGSRLRQLVGVLLVLTGLVLAWFSVRGMSALSPASARAQVLAHHSGVGVGMQAVVHVQTHPVWALLVLLCAVFLVLAGVVCVVRAPGWAAMSARYEVSSHPVHDEPATAQARDLALWRSLDRGEDPTA